MLTSAPSPQQATPSTWPSELVAVSARSPRAVASFEPGAITWAASMASTKSRLRDGVGSISSGMPSRCALPSTAATCPCGRLRVISKGAVNLAGAQRDRGVQGLGGLGVGGMGQAAAVSPVTSFQTANRRVISVR